MTDEAAAKDQLMSLLVSSGVKVSTFGRKEQNLEDVFINIVVPMALYFLFWMGTGMIPSLIYISPLLLTFSPAPEQMSALSIAFMTGEPVFSWLPLIATVVSCAIFIAVAIRRFNRHEF